MGRDDQRQAVKNIPLEQLKPFKNHPFQVRDDEEFRRLVESIEIHGVIHPAVARQIGAECYELISGHRRKAACEVLGYSEMPVLVRSMTDDEAVVNMVDGHIWLADDGMLGAVGALYSCGTRLFVEIVSLDGRAFCWSQLEFCILTQKKL